MTLAAPTLTAILGKDLRPNRQAFLEEEPGVQNERQPAKEDAEIVEEGRSIGECVRSDPAARSSIAIFVDGVESSATAGWYCGLPIRLAQVAAAAIRRDEKGEMAEVVAEAAQVTLLFPSMVDPEKHGELVDFCRAASIEPLPVELRTGEQDWNLALRDHVREVRNRLECEVVRKAAERANEQGWILADGRCPEASVAPTKYIVGLVKSHIRDYFTDEKMRDWILTLPAEHRTPVFRAAREEGARETFSWYLRLHESPDGPPWFGLIRLEMNDRQMAVQCADELTSWVLAERAPLSLPDNRYDRLLYPIRYIEQYLRSRQRSKWDLRALIG
jgi:hypothetical protein